jgi:hypothetical protein
MPATSVLTTSSREVPDAVLLVHDDGQRNAVRGRPRTAMLHNLLTATLLRAVDGGLQGAQCVPHSRGFRDVARRSIHVDTRKGSLHFFSMLELASTVAGGTLPRGMCVRRPPTPRSPQRPLAACSAGAPRRRGTRCGAVRPKPLPTAPCSPGPPLGNAQYLEDGHPHRSWAYISPRDG